MDIKTLHNLFLKFPKVSTDTRKVIKDSIFFALRGENFDGNEYAEEALRNGAKYAIIDNKEFFVSDSYILVDDVLSTLQSLATFHRDFNNASIIGLTGSNGKTTTKELINAVLSKKYRTIATVGNLNNHIGVPLTLLSIEKDTEIGVVEMGANHIKEIEFLCKLARPDFGYITNFGKAHLEGFGSEEGVIKGKSELYEYLLFNNKKVFLNADDPIQRDKLSSYISKFGFSQNLPQYYPIQFLGAQPFVEIKVENTIIKTNLIGSYNFPNCCAAILIGKYFNVPLSDIKNAIESYIPTNNRSQIVERNGHKIIMDAYNANPSSMEAALINFGSLHEDNKIAFLGDMFELGSNAAIEHQKIADLATKLKLKDVILIGKNFYGTRSDFLKFDSFEAVAKYIKNTNPNKKSILIKGSRGMALERILDLL